MCSCKYGSLRIYCNSRHVQNWWCPNVGLACYCNISIRNTHNTYIQSLSSSISAVLFSPKLAPILALEIETLKGRAWVGTWPPHPWSDITELDMTHKWGQQINIDTRCLKDEISSVSYCYKWWLGFQYSLYNIYYKVYYKESICFVNCLKRVEYSELYITIHASSPSCLF